MTPLSTGQGIVYAVVILIAAYVGLFLLSLATIAVIGLWGHP